MCFLLLLQTCAGDLLHTDLTMTPGSRSDSHHRLYHHSSQSCLSTTRSPPRSLCHNNCHGGGSSSCHGGSSCHIAAGGNQSYATLDHRLLRQPLPPPPQFTTSPPGGENPVHSPSCGLLNPPTKSANRTGVVMGLDDCDDAELNWTTTANRGMPHVWVAPCSSPAITESLSVASSAAARAAVARVGISCNSNREKCEGRQPLLQADQHESAV